MNNKTIEKKEREKVRYQNVVVLYNPADHGCNLFSGCHKPPIEHITQNNASFQLKPKLRSHAVKVIWLEIFR